MKKAPLPPFLGIALILLALGASHPLAAQPSVRALGVEPVPERTLEAAAIARGLVPASPVANRTSSDASRTFSAATATCVAQTITCNQTIQSTLTTDDCVLQDGLYADCWTFDGSMGQEVTVELGSSAFDTYLILLNPNGVAVAQNDNGGPGTDSRLARTLEASGEWSIVASNGLPLTSDPGSYTLSLQCSSTTPPATPTNLSATAVGPSQINLSWQDNANDETGYQVQMRTGSSAFSDAGNLPADTEAAEITSLDADTTYTFRVRASSAQGFSPFSNEAGATTEPDTANTCEPSAQTLCLRDGRFRVEVQWRDFDSNEGMGSIAELPSASGPVRLESSDSALFYFFRPDNWEMLVKVLDGCNITNHYWVFAAATTNVEYTLVVTDTEHDETKTYFNPLGTRSPAITDTSAFATCP